MSKKSVILSCSGLKNVIMGSQEEQFRFIIGQEEIKIPKIAAEFFSPRVSHIHRSDPTIEELDFNILLKDLKIESEVITTIINEDTRASIDRMTLGESIEINEKNEESLRKLSALLGNEELFEAIGTNSEKTVEERINEAILYSKIGGDTFSLESSKIIDDIASSISIKDVKKMKKIPRKIFIAIINSKNFKSDDEDALIEVINQIVSEGENEGEQDVTDIEMYENVDLKKLSEEAFREFISKFDFTQMTEKLWSKLCECFFTARARKKNEVVIEYDGDTSHSFSGIISYLRGNRKINISDEGIVSVSASSTEGTHHAKYAVEFDSDEFFHSYSTNDWLQIDFKEKKIRPTHYSIKTPSNHNHGDQQFPVNWCIEVSNTGSENDWRTIDTRENVTSISKRNQSSTFDIKTHLSSDEGYRFVRLKSTGKTSGNNGNIAFSSLEFFGTLIK